MNSIYGYFDSPEQTIPAYDPGLGVACPVCNRTMTTDFQPVKTISVMLEASGTVLRDNRSYFYRVHKACYEALTVEQQNQLDWPIVDARAQIKELN